MKLKKGVVVFLGIILFFLILILAFLLIGGNLLNIKIKDFEGAIEAPYLEENYEYPSAECDFLGLKANVELTKKVDLNTLGEQEAEYTCKKFIFKKVKKVKVIVKDKTPPKITLNGDNEVYVYIGRKYNELNAKAEDEIDGDLSNDIKISGDVDVSKLGTYEVKYTVVDKSGNEASEIRKVIVKEKPADNSCGEAGVIYLTFDDGPSESTTPIILDVLKKYDVKATFFVTSTGSDELIKREFDEGHAIGLHSSSHAYNIIYVSSEAFWNDMNKVAERVKNITGKDSDLLRFPGGASNTVSRKYNRGIMTQLAKEVEEKGYNFVDWNKDSGDAGQLKSSTFEGKIQEEINNVKNSLSKSQGNVILMHDIKQTTSRAIEEIVKYGIDNGYKFKVLDQSVICHQRINN